ncbi:polymeric immunoglobulin receptor-like [Scyliorhinus torazame]|uniref:polymeric immunoglobulin receptor-like n=1 Tax=Scyliorhinus torazame TaxID=75743 RepID=UPI003B5A9132
MVGKSYFLFSLLQVGLSQEWKAYTPEEVTAEKGSCVQIACNYSYPLNLTNRTRVGIWYYNKSGTVTTAFHSKDQNAISTQFLHRTRLSGDLNDDNCSLIINNVRQQDAGRYHFRIEFDGNNKYSYKPETRLQVSAEPSQEWKGEIPQQVTAQEGLCVQIPCHYSYPSCLGNQSRGGLWFNAESGTSQIAFHSKDHNHALSRFRDRTRLPGDLKDGDCSLIINNIKQEDAGPYYFRIEFDNGPSHSYHPVTRLQVSAEPSQEWKGETPQQVTAQEGLCVQIPCHYSYPSCLGNQSRGGLWFNEESGRSQIAFHSKDQNYKKPRFRDRTRLSGDLKDGDCSLIINNIRREDAGPYYFRIEFDGGPSHSYHPVTRLQVSAELSQEWKGETPQQVTAQEGLCVQIPCHYSYPLCLGNQSRGGLWFNEESGRSQIVFHSKDHNHKLPRFRDRTRLSGDLKDGDCSLIINNIRQEDAGPYYFRIEFDGGPSHSYHPVTWLNVSAEPSQEWKGETPQQVTAQEGLCVQIPCHYSYPSCLGNQSRGGVWVNEESGRSQIVFHSKNHNYELPRFRDRTRLSGDLKDGDCSLIINNITWEDAGPYYFRIEFDGDPSHSYHPVTWLNVSAMQENIGLGVKQDNDPFSPMFHPEVKVQIVHSESVYNENIQDPVNPSGWINITANVTVIFNLIVQPDCIHCWRKDTRSEPLSTLPGEAGEDKEVAKMQDSEGTRYNPSNQEVGAEGTFMLIKVNREVDIVQNNSRKCKQSVLFKRDNGIIHRVWETNREESGRSQIAFHSTDHNHKLSRFRHRIRLSGDLKDGDCSLVINNITWEDARPYYFRIEFDNGPSHSYHPVTRLHVSDFTDKPTIFPAEIIEGKRVDISCTFNTTCNATAPVLTWDTPTDVPGSVSNTVTQHGVTLTYTSVLSLTPSLKHNGQNLTCRVRYPSVSSERTLVLTVTYSGGENLDVILILGIRAVIFTVVVVITVAGICVWETNS